ncbi:OmpA family protein [Aquitalea sp.]|uniref:OmpA family protein n=1 Tax=Aquitalea sp. TaxID=1872623 RepID=UPI00258B689B|nr:OmpA family protein [Aquitalea sp.]
MKRILLCCLATLALSACSSSKVPQAPASAPVAAAPLAAKPVVDSAALAKAALDKKIDANIAANPDFVPFAAASHELDEVGKGQIQRQLASYQADKKLIVRGYCHRGSSSNARAMAHARAVAVKQFLVASGVPAKHISLRINTDKDAQGVQIASK